MLGGRVRGITLVLMSASAMLGSDRARALGEQVRAVFERNRQRGHARWCGLDYDFVCPSSGTYPFQWSWDSGFHAIALSRLDCGRAVSELRSLLANQQPDGFVAHVTFWQRQRYEALLGSYSIAYRTPYLSDCIQPPVVGESLEYVVRRGGGASALRELLPKLRRFFDWLDRVRDPDRDGLIATLQPDESGLDHTPKYQDYLGVTRVEDADFTAAWERVALAWREVERDPVRMFERAAFVVEDVLVNTIYALGELSLARLCAEAGDPAAAAEYTRRAERTSDALVRKCYDPATGLFFDLAGHEERPLRVNTVSSLLPLALPGLPGDIAARLITHLEDPREYAAPFPVPSVAMDEPSYVPGVCGERMVWRGPTWINTNWYLWRGLLSHGRPHLAETIADRSATLVERQGFREYYNPSTGEGHGAQDFSWTALVLDMVAEG